MSRVNISTLNIRIVGDARGVTAATNAAARDLRNLNNNANRSNQGLRNSFREFNEILSRTIALYAAFRAAAAIKNAVTDSVRLAADAEQAAIGFEVLLGSAEAASKTIESLYTFVETTPFRLDEVRDSAKLLAAFGFEQEKIIPTLRTLGDIASATGQPIKELADLFGRTRVEQRLYTRDLNQFTSRGIPLIEIFAEQFGIAQTEIRKMAEAGTLSFQDVEAALASATAEGGRYFELTKRQAETTAGEFSNFLDEVDALKRGFGEGLLPTLTEFLRLIREMIVGTDDGAAALRSMKDAGEAFGESLRLLGGTFLSLYSGLILVNIEFAESVRLLESLQRRLTSLDFSAFTDGYLDSLKRQFTEASEEAEKFFDFTRSLAVPRRVDTSGEQSLADMLGNVTNAAIKAKKELQLLQANAEKSAGKIRTEYASPLEAFKNNVREIQQAFASGGLEPEFVNRALAGEIDKLRDAYRKLKDELGSNPAIERGSQEDIASRFQNRFKSRTDDDVGDLKALIAEIAAQEKQRAIDLAAAATASATAAEELKEKTEDAAKKVEALGDAANKTAAAILSSLTKGLIEGAQQPGGTTSQKTGGAVADIIDSASFGFMMPPRFVTEAGVEFGQKIGAKLIDNEAKKPAKPAPPPPAPPKEIESLRSAAFKGAKEGLLDVGLGNGITRNVFEFFKRGITERTAPFRERDPITLRENAKQVLQGEKFLSDLPFDAIEDSVIAKFRQQQREKQLQGDSKTDQLKPGAGGADQANSNKELKKEIARTSKAEVSTLNQIAAAIERDRERPLIEIVEFSA